MYYIQVDIFEILKGAAVKTLSHTFYGNTPQDAQAVFNAHMKYDSFLHDMVATGSFKGIKGAVSYSQGRTLF